MQNTVKMFYFFFFNEQMLGFDPVQCVCVEVDGTYQCFALHSMSL